MRDSFPLQNIPGGGSNVCDQDFQAFLGVGLFVLIQPQQSQMGVLTTTIIGFFCDSFGGRVYS